MSDQCVLVLDGLGGSLLNSRGSLGRAFLDAGANVIVSAPRETYGVA